MAFPFCFLERLCEYWDMEVNIRAIQIYDAAAAAKLSGQFGYPCDAETMRQRILALQESPSDVAWVAELGDSILGWIQATRILRLESGEFAEIAGLVVDSRARGAGIGKQLVGQAQAWARAHGHKRLVVRMNVIRTETRGFYSKLGFLEKKQQVVWEEIINL